jgi:hypothetical protein
LFLQRVVLFLEEAQSFLRVGFTRGGRASEGEANHGNTNPHPTRGIVPMFHGPIRSNRYALASDLPVGRRREE